MSIITPPNLLPFSFFSHFGHHSLFLLQGEKKKGRKAHETFPLLASRGQRDMKWELFHLGKTCLYLLQYSIYFALYISNPRRSLFSFQGERREK
jgi:hypothetical protein